MNRIKPVTFSHQPKISTHKLCGNLSKILWAITQIDMKDYSIILGSALKLWGRVANFYTLFIFVHEILVKGKISLLHLIAESSVVICASTMHLYYCYKTPLYHVSVFYQNSEFLTNTLKVPFLYCISIYSCLSTFFSMEVYPPTFKAIR